MHKTAAEWARVRAEAVKAGSAAQAANVLQMALDDIAALEAAARPVLSILQAVRYTTGLGKSQLERIDRLRAALGDSPAQADPTKSIVTEE